MEYVNKLTDKINVGWDGEDYCLSDWNLRFLSRMNREVIKPPFTYQAFLDNHYCPVKAGKSVFEIVET